MFAPGSPHSAAEEAAAEAARAAETTAHAADTSARARVIFRLIGAVLAEQHDEWAEQRRYLGLEALTKARAVLTDRTTPDQPKEVPTNVIAGAINA